MGTAGGDPSDASDVLSPLMLCGMSPMKRLSKMKSLSVKTSWSCFRPAPGSM